MSTIPQNPFGVVYCIHNTASNRVYIGITTQRPSKRWIFHRWSLRHGHHYNPHLQRAWNKYGEVVFEFAVLEECPTQIALDEAEIFHIEYLRSIGATLYNQKSGGGFGGIPNAEMRRKMSEASKGKPKSTETRQRMSEGSKGVSRQRTPESEARVQEARRQASQRPEYKELRRRAAVERNGNIYHLTDPQGQTYTTRYLQTFCDEHGISANSARAAANGRLKKAQGWIITVERSKRD